MARVYQRGGVLFGCFRATGHTTRLATNFDDALFVRGRWSLVRLAGRMVAFRWVTREYGCKPNCQPRDPQWPKWALIVVDVRSGHRLRADASYGEAGRYQDLAITPNGDVAYVVAGSGLNAEESFGYENLDSGPIDPGSLRARGQTVFWRHRGAPRSARLH